MQDFKKRRSRSASLLVWAALNRRAKDLHLKDTRQNLRDVKSDFVMRFIFHISKMTPKRGGLDVSIYMRCNFVFWSLRRSQRGAVHPAETYPVQIWSLLRVLGMWTKVSACPHANHMQARAGEVAVGRTVEAMFAFVSRPWQKSVCQMPFDGGRLRQPRG